MKRVKKDAGNFRKLEVKRMSLIKGGYWLEYQDESGRTVRVWIDN